MSLMGDHIRFDYRRLSDVVIAYVDWSLESEKDVQVWMEEYRRYFTQNFDHKVDVIFELSKFHVSPKIATYFGKYRAQMLSEYTNLTYRVHISSREQTFMYTSSAIHGAPANHFDSIEDALQALLRDRASATKKAPGSG